jgi:hypothetical protein
MTFVPYVEALAFWGRAVQLGTVPRAYAAEILLDHPLITEHSPGSQAEKATTVATDLEQWEDRVVELLFDPDEDFNARLRRCGALRAERPGPAPDLASRRANGPAAVPRPEEPGRPDKQH